QVRTTQPVPGEFSKVYASQFLNYNKIKQTRYTPLDEEGEMLVICYDDFMPAMEPFVKWKNEKGIRTVMVPVSTVGNTRQLIKAFIENYYDTNNLAYVLLVGDAPQVPASQTLNGDSDIEYGYMAGTDSYPELFVGRFSGTTLAHIETQVAKSIAYEKTPATGAAAQWYKTAVGVASNEGPGDDGQYDYEHIREIRDALLDYTYDNVPELYQGSQGGLDAAGSPSASDLASVLNQGASLFNYTGHGNWDMIVTSAFYNTNVDALTNVNKWPFIWIVGCQTGNFVGNTCFAEKFARATTPNGHTGAIATMMATINQTWNPPMEGQDEMNAILTESYTNNIKRTFGGISFNGCMQMNDAYPNFDQGAEMTDTWILFGDPSLVIRTDVPTNLAVTHAGTVPMGVTTLQVNCNVNGALAALSLNGELLSTATVVGGVATFTFDAITVPDTMLVTVTGYNTDTYQGNVLVIPANGPYVISQTPAVTDVSGNGNGNADYSETVDLAIPLNNMGNADAMNITATLATNDMYVTVTNASVTYGDLTAGTTLPGLAPFQVQVAPIVPDMHQALLVLTITDNAGTTWTSNVNLTLHAPVLQVVSHTINDASGNNNGRLDPGENAVINLVVSNNGSADATIGSGVFATSGWQVTVPTGTQAGPVNIADGGTITQSFNVTVDGGATLYSFVNFNYDYEASGYTANTVFNTKIGQASEDFETNDFTLFNWQQQGNANWYTTNINPFEGTYSSRSGDIGESQSTSLILQVSAAVADTVRFARRVSSEDGYDFLKFYVNGVEKGSWSGVLPWTIVKYPVAAGSNTLKWTYAKDNWISANSDAAWVDAIDLPLNALATAIFENETSNMVNDANVFPNPATAQATLWYAIGQNADVSIDVYNVLGQHVTELQATVKQNAGSYNVDLHTATWPAGQYLIKFIVNGHVFARKLNVIK
ncbi:MAG TPA: C25 family cysteine peptidase, partial [Chitinophagales bacterium]|nr:C25 family cysteine peptidase [Chitinophagales bacterium]